MLLLQLEVDGQCFPALRAAFSRQLRMYKNTGLLNSVFSVLLALMPSILTAPSFTAKKKRTRTCIQFLLSPCPDHTILM